MVLTAIILTLVGCQTTSNSESDQLTWLKGYISNPHNEACGSRRVELTEAARECLGSDDAGAEGPLPAVIFLHGCTGFNDRQFHVMDLLIDSGYIVFAPDSFARPGRTKACGSSRSVAHLRYAEIRIALARIREIPWIDPNRVALAGFSSGGLAAAEYGGDEFKARIIMGYGCGRGINGPRATPVLNLVGRFDKETAGGNALCNISGRLGSAATHVSSGHDVADDRTSAKLIREFLDRVL